MAYGQQLLACNTFSTNPQSAKLTQLKSSRMYLLYKDFLSLFFCILFTVYGGSPCISYKDASNSFFRLPSASTSGVPIYSTRSGFLLVHMAMLPRTLTTTDAMTCTVLAPHTHALSLPQ